ncbi:MAG: UPF0179 family protein [Euryarchaeota archaeon]|nr:UPF0179 family protein [Euryarchaeota archaeon]
MPLGAQRIAIVERSLARKGFKYYHLGLSDKCNECEYKSVCSRLKEGSLYEVIDIRDKILRCLLIEEEAVVVRVTEIPIEIAIPQKKSFGTVFTYSSVKCDPSCQYYRYCVKPRSLEGKKLRIVERVKTITCPKTNEIFTIVRALVEE